MSTTIKITSLQKRQREIARSIIDTPASITKYHVIRASRQSGKTYLLERIAIAFSFERPDQCGAVIMATNSQTRKVFKSMTKTLPKNVILKTNNTDGSRYIEFVNGTILYFFSSGSFDSVAGNSFDFMICDEHALWNRHAWPIIKPTVAAKKNAKVIVASTPRGRGAFKTLCEQGQSSDVFVVEYTMSYLDNEHYDIREVEDARKSLPDALFRQEYLAEFVDGISSVFGDMTACQTLVDYPDINKNWVYYFGLDVAGDGEDCTILTIIDRSGKIAGIWHIDSSNLVIQSKLINDILARYPRISGLTETNGIGKGLHDMVKKSHKFTTTQDTKQTLVLTLVKDINSESIELPSPDLCPELDSQMSEYMAVRSKNGKLSYHHPIGEHDDYVDSLMLANYARQMPRLRGQSLRS